MDRISDLPDDILGKLLDSLTLGDAVATSVLSKRWRLLWAKNLSSLDLSDLQQKFPIFPGIYDGPDRKMTFSEVVTRILMLRTGVITTLRLSVTNQHDRYNFESWVLNSFFASIKILDLEIRGFEVPRCILNHKCLVELRLTDGKLAPSSGMVFLPKLLKLCLNYVVFGNNNSLRDMILGCPCLEELEISRDIADQEDNMVDCIISSNTLQKLTLMGWSGTFAEILDHTLELRVPALYDMRIDDGICMIVANHVLPSIDRAEIVLRNDASRGNNIYLMSVISFVRSLSKAKSLNIVTNLTGSFPASARRTSFSRLTCLTFRADWRILTVILENAEHLQSINIEKVEDELKCWEEPRKFPGCFVESLTRIRIDGFKCNDAEVDLASYVLRNARALKGMRIYIECKQNLRLNSAMDKLGGIVFASLACELEMLD